MPDHTKVLLKQKHIEYIRSLDNKKDDLEYWLTEHLRMSGLYWGLTALYMLGAPDALPREEVIDFVLSCFDKPSGGFSAHPNHDPHILYTLSAIQILFMEDALDRIDQDAVAKFVCGLQQEDGSVKGDQWGEVDTRFLYIAVQTLSILGRLDQFNTDGAVEFIHKCRNFDGGYGLVPGAESHSGQICTCVCALSILNRLDLIDTDLLSWWLCERQLPEGGLNGRPEKLPDVCYSWWVLSSLSILGHLDWIDKSGLRNFILKAQDEETGGIADREGDQVDVYHTVFGIAGLSLMGFDDLEPIDPAYCLPVKFTSKIPKWTKRPASHLSRT